MTPQLVSSAPGTDTRGVNWLGRAREPNSFGARLLFTLVGVAIVAGLYAWLLIAMAQHAGPIRVPASSLQVTGGP